jgi:hypothetical protein
LQVPGGSTLRELLETAGFSADYLEKKVQTAFIDGQAIDNFQSSSVGTGTVIALSAAMPGLAGAILRKGSPISALRSRGAAEKDSDRPHVPAVLVRLKLFNVVAEDMGPGFLRAGAVFSGSDFQDFLSIRRGLLRDTIVDAEFNGKAMPADRLFEYSFSTLDYVFLKVLSD